MSLLCDNNWIPSSSIADDGFNSLFAVATWIDIAADDPLILSATTLGNKCYKNMFNGCTGLTKAPLLPATSLAAGTGNQGSYCQMFQGCSNLAYVKCLATANIGQSKGTQNWLNSVKATGTFVKAPTASWATGNGGIPSGWTVETATE